MPNLQARRAMNCRQGPLEQKKMLASIIRSITDKSSRAYIGAYNYDHAFASIIKLKVFIKIKRNMSVNYFKSHNKIRN